MDFAGAETIGTDPELYALREAGARISDVLNQAIIDGGLKNIGRWHAFRLEDGTGDGTTYDTYADAVAHQSRPCLFEPLRPSSYSPDEAAMMLHYARAAYGAGWRNDPGYPAPIRPVRAEDAARKVHLMEARARRTRARSRFRR